MTDSIQSAHPWVIERRDDVRFGVQVFPLPDDSNPSATVIAAGLVADEVGLDGFFIGDHPGYHIEPWVHLAAVAVQTRRVTLGSVVNCVMHRHPAMLGRLAADLDRISGGRCLLGLGIGWNKPEFAQLGIPFEPVPTRQRALEEAIRILDGMFGHKPFVLAGETWSTTGAAAGKAVRARRPPLLIAGAGDRTLRQVALYADVSNFGSSTNTGNVSEVAVPERLAFLDRACEEIGRDPADILRSHFTSWLMLAGSRDLALAKRERYYPDGLSEEQSRTRIAGTPAEVVDYYRGLVAQGFRYLVVQIQDASDLETIRLLGAEVAPHVGRS